MNIGEDTTVPILRRLLEEVGRRSKIQHAEALAFEQKSNRVSYRVVVIDNVYCSSDRQGPTPICYFLYRPPAPARLDLPQAAIETALAVFVRGLMVSPDQGEEHQQDGLEEASNKLVHSMAESATILKLPESYPMVARQPRMRN